MFNKIANMIPEGWKQRFQSHDWLLVAIVAVLIVWLWIGFRMTDNSIEKKELINENKTLTDSVSVLNERVEGRDRLIRDRDEQISKLAGQFEDAKKLTNIVSAKYQNQIRQNEKSVSNYRRLSTDQRVGEFTNVLSGKN